MLGRLLRHLAGDLALNRRFPRAVLQSIERAVREQEKRHLGELRFAVEGGLEFASLLRGAQARERALELFARLRVWDTEDNSGVLVYVLLGDRAVEIVADRGIERKVAPGDWQDICRRMQARFAAGDFEAGALEGLARAGDLLARHFPAGAENPNELPDEPLVL